MLILDNYIILLKLKFTIKPVLFPSCSTYTYNTESSYLLNRSLNFPVILGHLINKNVTDDKLMLKIIKKNNNSFITITVVFLWGKANIYWMQEKPLTFTSFEIQCDGGVLKVQSYITFEMLMNLTAQPLIKRICEAIDGGHSGAGVTCRLVVVLLKGI